MGMLPSTTTILDTVRLPYVEKAKMYEAIRNFKKCNNPYIAIEESDTKSSDYGTLVHEALHDYLNNKVRRQFPHWETALPLLDWVDQNVKSVLASELTLVSHELGCAGTSDAVLLLNDGRKILADLKVVKFFRRFPPKPPLNYRCQLSVYAEILKKEFGPLERESFYLPSPFGEDRTPKLLRFKYQRDYLPEYFACKTLWYAQYGEDQNLECETHTPTPTEEHFSL
jgi:hypothetical protein